MWLDNRETHTFSTQTISITEHECHFRIPELRAHGIFDPTTDSSVSAMQKVIMRVLHMRFKRELRIAWNLFHFARYSPIKGLFAEYLT
jgi:hypothetical protein